MSVDTDIQLVPVISPDIITLDWLQTPTNLIDETNELVTAVIVALNTDAEASVNDILPDPRSKNRRGWWGDYQAEQIWNGWPIGCKLWLLHRAKIVDNSAKEGATVTRVIQYINEALQPFVTNGIFASFTVEAWQSSIQRISARIKIYRGSKQAIQLEFQSLWQDLFPGSDV